MATLMAVLPLQREGPMSDGETIQRFAQRPQTVVDALYLAQVDLLLGCTAGLVGLWMDPYEGGY